MRAAAILGLGSSVKQLRPFQKNSSVQWTLGLPATANDADAVLIFGGDGTIHRHLAALVELRLPVLVVPCGSGNDFARALKLRSVNDALAAWRGFADGAGKVRAVDLGVIRPLEMQIPRAARNDNSTKMQIPWSARNDHPEMNGTGVMPARSSIYFCCAGGAGLDAEIARRANRLPRWLRGHGGYVFSLLPALARFQPVATKVFVSQADDSERWELRSAGPMFVAVFANTADYGGGMNIAPGARLDDGLLNVCTVSEIDKFKLFCLFPTVYFGRHLNLPEVHYFQAARLKLETGEPLDVYADGEFVGRTPIEVSVAPHALRVITG
jgi:diacylglycerol kinase (ATP)